RRRLQLRALRLEYGVVLLRRHAATTRLVPPANRTIAALAQFLQAIVINVGGRCNATASTDRVDYVVFHRLARTQQPQARLLTAVGATRKRRAVFGFRLSVCH